MTEKTIYIVQQFEKQGKKLVQGRQLDFPSADQAKARAERDAERFAGVIAVSQTVDIDSDEVLDEPVILAIFGEVPAGIVAE